MIGFEKTWIGRAEFVDLGERYLRRSQNGDPLVKLAALIDFEPFWPKSANALMRSGGSQGGRPPYDPVVMFARQGDGSDCMRSPG